MKIIINKDEALISLSPVSSELLFVRGREDVPLGWGWGWGDPDQGTNLNSKRIWDEVEFLHPERLNLWNSVPERAVEAWVMVEADSGGFLHIKNTKPAGIVREESVEGDQQ